MAQHNHTGKIGEDQATRWFQQQGYTVIHRNWRYLKYEIDLIAYKEEVLHIIEVKTRTGLGYGYPEEAVSKKKIEKMMKCGEQFQIIEPQWKRIQYNILSITMHNDGNTDYFLIEDIYC